MDFDPATLDWQSEMLHGWTYEKAVNKWFQGSFRSAHRLTRQCPTCSETIVLDVTAKALRGEAKNHGLALRRCKECRQALKKAPQEYAERKARSRPYVDSPNPAEPPSDELETLRMTCNIMREELAGCYATIKELNDRLAQYELPAAMAAVNGHQKKMPWE